MTVPTDFPRCETCRHWRVATSADPENFNLIGCSGCGISQGEDRRFEAVGQSGGEFLATLPTFGCIAHEPRD